MHLPELLTLLAQHKLAHKPLLQGEYMTTKYAGYKYTRIQDCSQRFIASIILFDIINYFEAGSAVLWPKLKGFITRGVALALIEARVQIAWLVNSLINPLIYNQIKFWKLFLSIAEFLCQLR